MQSALKARVDRPVGDPVPILGETNMTTSYHLGTRLSRDMNHHSPQVESAHWGQPIKPLHVLHLKFSWKSRRSLVGCATCAGTSKKNQQEPKVTRAWSSSFKNLENYQFTNFYFSGKYVPTVNEKNGVDKELFFF